MSYFDDQEAAYYRRSLRADLAYIFQDTVIQPPEVRARRAAKRKRQRTRLKEERRLYREACTCACGRRCGTPETREQHQKAKGCGGTTNADV